MVIIRNTVAGLGEAFLVHWSHKPPAVPANCQECPIRDLTICQPLSGEFLKIVEEFKRGDRVLPAGSQLYRLGEASPELYNLLDGWVALYRILESGRCQILDLALPGSFLGYQPDLLGPMLHGAICLTDVAVCVFPRQPFTSLIESNSSLALRLVWLTARDTLIAHEHMTNIGSRSAEARIAHLLLELCLRVRRHCAISDDQDVEIPLTQQHIADVLGLTSVYVSQTLKKLREKKLLEFKSGRLRVLDLERLAKLADFDELFIV